LPPLPWWLWPHRESAFGFLLHGERACVPTSRGPVDLTKDGARRPWRPRRNRQYFDRQPSKVCTTSAARGDGTLARKSAAKLCRHRPSGPERVPRICGPRLGLDVHPWLSLPPRSILAFLGEASWDHLLCLGLSLFAEGKRSFGPGGCDPPSTRRYRSLRPDAGISLTSQVWGSVRGVCGVCAAWLLAFVRSGRCCLLLEDAPRVELSSCR